MRVAAGGRCGVGSYGCRNAAETLHGHFRAERQGAGAGVVAGKLFGPGLAPGFRKEIPIRGLTHLWRGRARSDDGGQRQESCHLCGPDLWPDLSPRHPVFGWRGDDEVGSGRARIVGDEDPTPAILADPELWSGRIAGASRENRFLEMFEEAGFCVIEVLSCQEEPWQVIDGVEFRSMTVRAFKGKKDRSGEYSPGKCC
jgi:hypothetical protein